MFDDRENYIDDVTDADLYKCIELNCELPGAGQLQARTGCPVGGGGGGGGVGDGVGVGLLPSLSLLLLLSLVLLPLL